MAERSKFQFRMRDLLWAVSLIGVSLGLAVAGSPFLALFMWVAVFVGAVRGAPRRTQTGMIVGILVTMTFAGIAASWDAVFVSESEWRSLEQGMTKAEVISICGNNYVFDDRPDGTSNWMYHFVTYPSFFSEPIDLEFDEQGRLDFDW